MLRVDCKGLVSGCGSRCHKKLTWSVSRGQVALTWARGPERISHVPLSLTFYLLVRVVGLLRLNASLGQQLNPDQQGFKLGRKAVVERGYRLVVLTCTGRPGAFARASPAWAGESKKWRLGPR